MYRKKCKFHTLSVNFTDLEKICKNLKIKNVKFTKCKINRKKCKIYRFKYNISRLKCKFDRLKCKFYRKKCANKKKLNCLCGANLLMRIRIRQRGKTFIDI